MKERFFGSLRRKMYMVDALLVLSALGSIVTTAAAWDIHNIREQGRVVWSTKMVTEEMKAYVEQANRELVNAFYRDLYVAKGGLVTAIGSVIIAKRIKRNS